MSKVVERLLCRQLVAFLDRLKLLELDRACKFFLQVANTCVGA